MLARITLQARFTALFVVIIFVEDILLDIYILEDHDQPPDLENIKINTYN